MPVMDNNQFHELLRTIAREHEERMAVIEKKWQEELKKFFAILEQVKEPASGVP